MKRHAERWERVENLKDVYGDGKIRVACYMTNASSQWKKKHGRMKWTKKELQSEVEKCLRGVGMTDIMMTQDGVKRNSMRIEEKKQRTELD